MTTPDNTMNRRSALGLSVGAAVLATGCAPAHAGDADAEIHRLAGVFHHAFAATAKLDDPSDSPLWDVWNGAFDQLMMVKPQTIQGMEAKFRVFYLWNGGDGSVADHIDTFLADLTHLTKGGVS